jgi:exosortase/archaeosortase family protein
MVWIAPAVALATWDAWRWLIYRLGEEPEQGAVLLLTVVLVLGVGVLRRDLAGGAARSAPILTLAAVLALYAVSYAYLPPIMRAGLAVPATLYAIHAGLLRHQPPVAFWGLVALALPVLPSLQLVLGYPMRAVAAAASAGLLQAQGLVVERQGTLLVWQGRMVQFDAPCSGVNMLWAGLMLAFMGSLLLRLDVRRTAAAVALAVVTTLVANVLRGTSLFYIEAGIVTWAPAWWHEALGIAAFAFAAALMFWTLPRMAVQEDRA